MANKVVSGFFIIIFGVVIFAGGYWFGQSPLAPVYLFYPETNSPDEVEDIFAPFWETWQLVHTRFYELPVDDVALTDGAINGMLEVLGDPYTRYLPPVDEQAAREQMAGEIQGIGVLVEFVDGDITIVSPFEGSPAEAAGLQAGDILRSADGVDLTGLDLTDAAGLVRGPAGTTVSLVVERDGETFSIDVVRDVISIPSVRGEMLEDNIAYVRLSRFGDQSAAEMSEVLQPLLAENPAGLILDLRGNPGGGLTTAVNVADLFLDEGTILVQRFGTGDERVFKSEDGGLAVNIPMVVLVDEGSASASEVLAGAIRDRERGILVGQTTFGKGTMQTWQALSNDGGVRITNARWLTPDGTWVNEEGLVPDLEVTLPEITAESDPDTFTDTQLDAAITYLLTGSLSASE